MVSGSGLWGFVSVGLDGVLKIDVFLSILEGKVLLSFGVKIVSSVVGEWRMLNGDMKSGKVKEL